MNALKVWKSVTQSSEIWNHVMFPNNKNWGKLYLSYDIMQETLINSRASERVKSRLQDTELVGIFDNKCLKWFRLWIVSSRYGNFYTLSNNESLWTLNDKCNTSGIKKILISTNSGRLICFLRHVRGSR